jgi:mono/diheme cytochrome c family protein
LTGVAPQQVRARWKTGMICPMRRINVLFLLAIGMSMVGTTAAQSGASSRGELLYTTHCVACHNEQMHWRQFRLATDWPSLKEQVQRWQSTAKLRWSDEDVEAVAGYLNDSIYRYVRPDVRTGALALSR